MGARASMRPCAVMVAFRPADKRHVRPVAYSSSLLLSIETFERLCTSAAQEWKVAFDDLPKPVDPDAVVFVPKPVAERPDLISRLARHQFGCPRSEP
jgi:hypothetical protein